MTSKDEDLAYASKNIPLYEAIYGKNLISLGGTAAIDNMFSDVDLNEKRLLDVGFGLGGVAYYLATTRHSNDDASPMIKETNETYLHTLNIAGFSNIKMRDDSQAFIGYTKLLLENINKHADFIKTNFNDSLFDILNSDHHLLLADINAKRKMAVRITANKKEQD